MTALIASLMLAQVLAPNNAGVSMGHLHITVSNEAATKHFWVDLMGAQPVKLSTIDGVKIPGAIILFRQGTPTGPTVGSVIEHVGVKVKSLSAYTMKLKAAGLQVDPQPNPKQAMVNDPNGVRVEMTEDETISTPIENHHIHWYVGAPLEIQAWYVKNFAAIPGKRAKYDAADLPGVNLTFGQTDAKVLPTKGRALDHIGFEVKNLEAFCKSLEAKGIKFDVPYKVMPALGISIAFFTDPWGTTIELTEGLNKL
jgi:catechol 2,3-dioxygenase-like lactoylglutathione lyase family enzyme